MSGCQIDVETGVRRIIGELLGAWVTAAELPLDIELADQLGMKALDRAELALEIEGDFGITVFTRPFAELRTVGDVVAYVEATLLSPMPRVEASA